MARHFLTDVGVSQAVVARATGLTTNRLNEIAQDKRGISAGHWLRLAAYFGTTAQLRLNVQTAWDLWHELTRRAPAYGAIRQRRPQAVREAESSGRG